MQIYCKRYARDITFVLMFFIDAGKEENKKSSFRKSEGTENPVLSLRKYLTRLKRVRYDKIILCP